MSHRATDDSSGFTIVEVLIVLAIAGLIFSLILLAVPALTRSSRNSERRTGVASILHSVSFYALNHGGSIVPSCTFSGATSCVALFQSLSFAKIPYYNGANGFGTGFVVCDGTYSSGSLSFGTNADCSPASSSQPTRTDPDKVLIFNYQHCDPNTPGAGTNIGAGYSDVVALYAIETGSATGAGQCQEL